MADKINNILENCGERFSEFSYDFIYSIILNDVRSFDN
jgi:hypothetical protein